MERLLRRHSTVGMTIEVETPMLKPEQVPQTPSLVEEINLKFRVQVQCNHFQVAEDNTITLVRRHKSRKLRLATHQLSVYIFNRGGRALQQYLSSRFARYRDVINIKAMSDKIINKWAEIKEEANSSMFGKVFPLVVTLKVWNVVSRHERRLSITDSEDRMVPTSNTAIEEVLKRVKIEEIERDETCVICLEEMGKEEKSAILQMPCLHVFHEECLKKWLSNSHYCPTCRFQMPTDD